MLYRIMTLGKFFSVVGVKVFHVYFTTAKCCQCLQRKLLFLKKIRTCDNSIISLFSIMSTYEYGKVMSKHSICNLC